MVVTVLRTDSRVLFVGWMDSIFYIIFFFNDTATTDIYTLSLHDALPISALAELPCMAQTSFDWAARILR